MQRQSPTPVTPSCIISPLDASPGGLGGLYHGSFRAVMNMDFLKKEGVTHIVNTAKGLEIFGPKYTVRYRLRTHNPMATVYVNLVNIEFL